MRVPFVGQAYAPRSLAVGAQTLINLYAEEIEDPSEKAKNTAVMYGSPGYLLFKNMTAIDAGFANLRGIWSGGGRVFVAGGNGSGTSDGRYVEINRSTGAQIGSVRTISNAPVNGFSNAPVQFFANGNQLMIVGGGFAYIDNGAGPVAITLPARTGNVETFGSTDVKWVSGDKFPPDIVGATITISATPYTVDQYFDSENITVTAGIAALASRPYTLPAPTFGALTGGYLDSYYLVGRPNSRQYNISRVNNAGGSVWNGLDFNTKNSYPDNLRCLLSADDVYLFGQETTDVHRNTGGTFPFTKMDGASFRVGTSSPWSPIEINSRVFFMGISSQGRVVAYVLDGYTPVRISTHAEEYQWSTANLGINCISYSEEHEGHYWWVVNFGAQAWQYDLISGAWSQRAKWSGSAFTPFEQQFHTYVAESGKHLVCGNNSSIVYETSLGFYEENGGDFAWERTLPHMYAGGKMQYFGRMTLEMQTGTAPSGTPVVTRTQSDDRGQTFGNPQTASIGSAGQNSLRVFWPGTSASRDRVYRLTGIGKGKVALISLEMNYKIGKT